MDIIAMCTQPFNLIRCRWFNPKDLCLLEPALASTYQAVSRISHVYACIIKHTVEALEPLRQTLPIEVHHALDRQQAMTTCRAKVVHQIQD